jgi:hypothetical protein
MTLLENKMAKGPTGKIGKAWRKQDTRGNGINRAVTQRQQAINNYLARANGMAAVSNLLANLMDRAGLILEVPVQEPTPEAEAV